MPLSYDTEIVTGSYINQDGSYASGQITFQAQVDGFLSDSASSLVIVPTTFWVSLDASGHFTIDLPASNDPNVLPTGFTYVVIEALSTGRRTYSIAVEVGGGPYDLSSLSPSVPVTATVQMVRTVNGVQPDTSGNVAVTGVGAVSTVNGRSGAVVVVASDVGLGNVNNTSDANKPISTATLTALGAKAPIASPTFTGTNATTGQILKVGPSAYGFTPVGSQSAYAIVDKASTSNDSSLLLRDQGAIRAEVGLAGDDNLHIKAVTGLAGTEIFTDAIIVQNSSGAVEVATSLGVGTIPTVPLHVAGAQPSARILEKIENTSGAGSALELKGVGADWVVETDIALNGGNNLGISDSAAGYPPRLVIDGNGKIAIGSDTPGPAAAHSLDVVGSINTRGTNSINGLNLCGRNTTTGHPTTSTWAAGDAVVDSGGVWWICTSAGTPGTWVTGPPSANGGSASTAPPVVYTHRKDTAANWASANPVLSAGEVGYETDTDLAKIGDGASSWTSLGYSWMPYSVSPYAQLSAYLGFKSCNGDPANMQSSPGWPSGILLMCKAFIDVPGVISNIALNCLNPDTTAALTGVYAGIFDATGTGGTPGTLLGVTADFSTTVKALTSGTGGKLLIPLVTPTASQPFGKKIFLATLCAAQSTTPVMTFVGGRNFGTNGPMSSDYRLWRSTSSILATIPSTAPTGSNIQVSNSSYIGMGAL